MLPSQSKKSTGDVMIGRPSQLRMAPVEEFSVKVCLLTRVAVMLHALATLDSARRRESAGSMIVWRGR